MEQKDSFLITQIGSLPHHNTDAAISYAFKHDIPFLPQIPLANPKEFMLVQALQNFPGLKVGPENEAQIDLKLWLKEKDHYAKLLKLALEEGEYTYFNPKAQFWSCWRPFLFECEERNVSMGKIQVVGPLTAQMVTKLTDGEVIKEFPELMGQIAQSVVALAHAMISQLKERNIKPLIFIDEPGLYAFNPADPWHISAFEELRLFMLSLKKRNVVLGLHCCADTDWAKVLDLPIDILSFDVKLSGRKLFEDIELISNFINNGGHLGLGIIPTHSNGQIEIPVPVEKYFDFLKKACGKTNQLAQKILQQVYLTPACGLAYKSPKDAESIFSQLRQIQMALKDFYRELWPLSITPPTN